MSLNDAKKSILVLEDQPLIALDIEQVLMDAGFGNVTVMTSCKDAETWLREYNPDLAIIDVHLRDGICSTAAQMLVDGDVPFVVHSALDTHNSNDGSVFSHGKWVSKPSLPDRLVSVVMEAMA